ncbi:MAG: hypothetical protein JW920_11165 [Deltaproteobacteria bacterium]|nr:hypothetical protein [Deltaproteobacteria bacterium]
MEAARKLYMCACGVLTEKVCENCGEPVCDICSTLDVVRFDPGFNGIGDYCPNCKKHLNAGVLDNVHWIEIAGRFA